MLQIKILLSCILLQVVASAIVDSNSENFPADELKEAIPISSDDIMIPKANWSPICQTVEVNPIDEYISPSSSNLELPGAVISPVRLNDESTCDAPNGLGLQNLLKQSKALIPFDRLKAIVSNASNDPEVKRLRELIHSDIFRSKFQKFIESSHFTIFRDYVCKSLFLDIEKLWEYFKSLVSIENLNEMDEDIVPIEISKGRPGIFGLVQDLHDALPKQKLRDLYVSLLVSDDQLVMAIRQMRSEEFKQLIENLTKLKEFIELREMLQKVGVPLKSVKELIDVALGWYVNELEENFEKI